jgi:hypothetical protein
MLTRRLTWLLCLAALFCTVLTSGCSSDPARRYTQTYTVRTDLGRLAHEIDWILGLDEPSILFDASMPPYYYR